MSDKYRTISAVIIPNQPGYYKCRIYNSETKQITIFKAYRDSKVVVDYLKKK